MLHFWWASLCHLSQKVRLNTSLIHTAQQIIWVRYTRLKRLYSSLYIFVWANNLQVKEAFDICEGKGIFNKTCALYMLWKAAHSGLTLRTRSHLIDPKPCSSARELTLLIWCVARLQCNGAIPYYNNHLRL